MSITLVGTSCPRLPWEERPAGDGRAVWRYSRNPVIRRDLIPGGAHASNSIFNSAVVPFGDGFAGVFRCDDRCRRMDLHQGTSPDGLAWTLAPQPIAFVPEDPAQPASEYKYDPRVTRLDDRWYVTWCNGCHGPTIGLAWTTDFATFHQMENAFLPHNRNGVLFPRRIRDRYVMLSRPSDTGHTPFGDIWISQSPDLRYWGGHRHVMSPTVFADSGWQSTKVGAGPVPIETSEGWLLLYHGVLTSCNGFVYSMGAALLDLEQPWKVIRRSRPYLLSPQTDYECVGDVPNVVFPCAALTDAPSGRIAIYYGAADTVTGLAFTRIDWLMDFLRENALPG